MATPAQRGAVDAIMYGLAIMQAAALRGSKAAADGVQRAVQLINSAPNLQSVPTPVELGGSLVRKVGDLMLPSTHPSTKAAPAPTWGSGAKPAAKTSREVVDTSSRQIPPSRQTITPPARPVQSSRPATSSAPAPVPAFGDRGAFSASVMPTAPGPRAANIPGVPGNYFEGSVFRSGVPDPWTTAPIQSRLEPFNFPEAAASSSSVQALLSPGFEALQGTQMALPLRQRAGAQALVDYVTSKGATRPAGTSLGGQAFSQAPFNVPVDPTNYLRDPGGRPLVPIENISEYSEAAFGPGQSLQAQLASWGLDPAQVDSIIAQYSPNRNAMGGVNLVDNLPAAGTQMAEVALDAEQAGRNLGLLPKVFGASLLTGLGVGAYLRNSQNQLPSAIDAMGGRPPGATPLGDPTATIDSGANTPAVTGDPAITTPPAPAGLQNAIPGTVNPSNLGGSVVPPAPILPPPVAPAGPGPRPVVSAAGAGSVTQHMDSGDSEYRQVAQNAAQGRRPDVAESSNLADFYRKRAAFANAPGRAEEIIGALKGMGAPASVGIESEANFETWARKHPELAYNLQLQTQRRRDLSQQMPQKQGVALGTPIGTNNAKNAAGQSQAAALSATYGGQGPSELMNALNPQAYQITQKMPLF